MGEPGAGQGGTGLVRTGQVGTGQVKTRTCWSSQCKLKWSSFTWDSSVALLSPTCFFLQSGQNFDYKNQIENSSIKFSTRLEFSKQFVCGLKVQ